MLRDLSGEGFALRAMMPVHPGEKTPFSFFLSESVRIEGQGDIHWIEEGGKVAGIRFAELSDTARSQIDNWLQGKLEPPPTQERMGKPAVQDVRSFEELRQELRSTAVRHEPVEPNQTQQPAPVQEETPQASSVEQETPLPQALPVLEELPANIQSTSHENPPIPEEASAKPELLEPQIRIKPFPRLPKLSTPRDAAATRFGPVPAVPPASPKDVNLIQPASGSKLQGTPDGEPASLPAPARLPDISEVLIQPPHWERNQASKTAVLQSLNTLHQHRGHVEASWTDWFTLSRAVAIMAGLALAVALAAYHRNLGQALVWLGGEMGGAPDSTGSVPPASEVQPAEQANPSSTNTPAPADSAGPSANSGPSQTNTNQTSVRPTDNSQPKMPSTAQNSTPITPLFGLSSPAASETGPEAGLAEYNQAMRILHGKNASGDTSEAVRLLWDSVEKGNASAELALAELYWRGQGVARNCDQTRILLSAAARKGNADAQKRLRQFQREGCE